MQRKSRSRPLLWKFLFILYSLAVGGVAYAQIRLPKVFNNHMVMQQEKPLVVWGWASPNEAIKIQLGSESAETRANAKGEWKVTLPAMKAGGPYKLTISGSKAVEFDDVMIGEVWL